MGGRPYKAQSNERLIGEGMDAESETSSFHLPQRGNAYQPRASLWEPRPRGSVCSEGAPQRVGRGRCPRYGEYAAFLQNAGSLF
jgi:hypothetical protein